MFRPYGTPMTEEERMAQAIARTRNPFAAPITMGSQVDAALQNVDPATLRRAMPPPQTMTLEEQLMVSPEADFSGRESNIQNQRAYANSLRGSKLPGLQTVGPSNIAVANPWEGLETAFNRAYGGYLSGRADREAASLGEEKREAALTQAKEQAKRDAAIESRRRMEADRGFGLDVRGVDLTEKGMNIDAAQDAATLAQRKAEAEATEADRRARLDLDIQQLLQKTQNDIASGWKVSQYVDLESGDPVMLSINAKTGAAHVGTSKGEAIPPDLLGTRYMEYTAPTDTGSDSVLARQEAAAQRQAQQALFDSEAATTTAVSDINRSLRQAGSVLINPDVDKFTGLINPARFFSQYGIGEEAWKGQSVNQRLRAASVAGIGDSAAIFKPMSDKDLELLLSTFPQNTDEPETITAWYGTTGREAMRKQYEQRKAEAVSDAEKANLDAAWNKVNTELTDMVAAAAYRQGISVDDARSLGIPKEELEEIYNFYKSQGM